MAWLKNFFSVYPVFAWVLVTVMALTAIITVVVLPASIGQDTETLTTLIIVSNIIVAALVLKYWGYSKVTNVLGGQKAGAALLLAGLFAIIIATYSPLSWELPTFASILLFMSAFGLYKLVDRESISETATKVLTALSWAGLVVSVLLIMIALKPTWFTDWSIENPEINLPISIDILLLWSIPIGIFLATLLLSKRKGIDKLKSALASVFIIGVLCVIGFFVFLLLIMPVVEMIAAASGNKSSPALAVINHDTTPVMRDTGRKTYEVVPWAKLRIHIPPGKKLHTEIVSEGTMRVYPDGLEQLAYPERRGDTHIFRSDGRRFKFAEFISLENKPILMEVWFTDL